MTGNDTLLHHRLRVTDHSQLGHSTLVDHFVSHAARRRPPGETLVALRHASVRLPESPTLERNRRRAEGTASAPSPAGSAAASAASPP